ncbi:MAG: M48 family metallopeptidase [Vicingaceae bacterium]|nr:M48 family metallopeptidase [Vicingaceae bacterium]
MTKYIILFLLFPISLFSQVSIDFGLEDSDTIPSKFKTSISELRNSIYDQIPSYSKRGKYEKVSYKFSDYVAHSESSLLQSGNIYSNWTELEDYLNNILQEVLPEKYKSNTNFHVYINKSGEPNAFASPAGNIYVNIGLLSDVNTEAKLAAVIAHELAHLISQHSFLHFIKNEFGEFGNGLVQRDWTSFRYSKNQELEADSLAFLWLKNSRYKTSELFNMFESIKARETRGHKKSSKWNKPELIPHATSKERLNAFNRFTQYDKTDNGVYFVISEDFFNKSRIIAKSESLKYLKQNENYYSCLEQSFRFHLLEPDNITYVYYIMESIRILGNNNPEIWDKHFLTYGNYDTLRINNLLKKVPITKSFFEELDIELAPLYSYELDSIKAKFYWEDDVKFNTYNEAIEFFNSLGKALKCNECLLTYGKSLVDLKLRDRYFKGYINSLQVSNNMDKCLLEKVSTDSVFRKKIIFIDDFVAFVKQGQERAYLTNDKTNINQVIKDSLIAHFPNKEFYLLSDIKNRSLTEYNELIALLYPELRYGVSDVLKKIRGEYINFGDVSQQSKNIFGKYGANEIEYLQCEIYESKNLNNSLEKYKTIVKSDYDEILKRSNTTRNLNIWLRGISLKNEKDLHYTRYKKLDNKIKFKNSGYDVMIPKIVRALKAKE